MWVWWGEAPPPGGHLTRRECTCVPACLWSFWTEEGTWAVVADKEGVGVYGCRRRGLHARMKKVGMQTGDGMV